METCSLENSLGGMICGLDKIVPNLAPSNLDFIFSMQIETFMKFYVSIPIVISKASHI